MSKKVYGTGIYRKRWIVEKKVNWFLSIDILTTFTIYKHESFKDLYYEYMETDIFKRSINFLISEYV